MPESYPYWSRQFLVLDGGKDDGIECKTLGPARETPDPRHHEANKMEGPGAVDSLSLKLERPLVGGTGPRGARLSPLPLGSMLPVLVFLTTLASEPLSMPLTWTLRLQR